MRIVNAPPREDIATVHVMDMGSGRLVECVESTQPPLTRDQKWVLIVSVLFGCPVQCLMCDAGGSYGGKLSAEQIFEQIDYLSRSRYPDGIITSKKFSTVITKDRMELLISDYAEDMAPQDPARQEEIRKTLQFSY